MFSSRSHTRRASILAFTYVYELIGTQHDFVIPVTGSAGTTYLYVGDRYSQHHGKGTGRNIFLPLIWEDGIPKLKWYESWKIDVAKGRYRCMDE